MLPDPQFFQILYKEWVNNTHLPVILAMVEVFRKKFAGMNLLPGHWTATQVVTSAQPCQSLGRLGRNHFFLKNHLKPLNHQIFHRGAAMRLNHLRSLQNRVRKFNCRFYMAIDTASFGFVN